MMSFRKNLGVFILLCVEIFILYQCRQWILDILIVMNKESTNYYDDILIGIVASILFSGLQFLNLFFIENIVLYSKKTVIKILQKVLNCTISVLNNANERMLRFIFSTTVKWGVFKNASVVKVANSAEGLIACATISSIGYEFTPEQKSIIKEVLDRLLKELVIEGYKSYNQDEYTVHCTAMGLYSIKKCIEANLCEINDEEEDKIRACLKKLLANANDLGWGFINGNAKNPHNRALSTIWALRALNVWGFSEHKRYIEVLMNFVGHSDGLIGFSEGNTVKCSTTALLYILANEIYSKKTREMLFERISEDKVVHFLIKNLNREVEVEEFVISITDTQKLPWTHLSECWAMYALAFSFHKLNIFQICKVFLCLKHTLAKIDCTHNYYTVESMNFNHSNPTFYPTTYLVVTFCEIIRQLRQDNNRG